jgi:eukaryotic-like serine/threonine-protein kinase
VERPEQWPKIKEIVGAALEREPSKREAYLDQACSQDRELRAEVESLLAAYDETGDFSLHPLVVEVDDAPCPAAKIGPYRLISELGVGGMGQVWLAEQTEPVRRQVALKLIKVGMYDAAVGQRFQAERQSLAIMDHPAIAKVFDAGATAAGQPYFVMEYVDGLPITDYCDEKKLGIHDRLKLFLQVCEGVQHAHQKAILHRDLKPSNILVVEVNGKPVPRIIDFGLAKGMTPAVPGETFFTQVGAFLGTPGYMSPEQANPNVYNNVDTRTDVYSLGVVLYELLTGYLPFDTAMWKQQRLDEVLRQLRETDPQRPSTRVSANQETSAARAEARGTQPGQLVSFLRGDLDWITLKALEKERARRYGTASEFAADIERYLENRPVVARPASRVYRLQKYIRRNRVAVAVVGGAAALLIAFAVMQTIQLRRITRERDRADRITQFMASMFKVSDPSEARGNTITAREILDKASTDIGTSLSRDPLVQTDLLDVMAGTYVNLGLYTRAHDLAQQVLAARLRLLGPNDRKTLQAMSRLGWILDREGRFSEAEALERQALVIDRRELAPDDPLTLETMDRLGVIMQGQGRYDEEERLEHEVVEGAIRRLGAEAELTLTSKNNLAAALLYQGRYAEAEKDYRQLVEVEGRVWGSTHPETLLALNNLAWSVAEQGRMPEAEQLFREAVTSSQRVLGPDHRNTALATSNLANLLVKEGHFDEAETLQREALAIYMRALGPQHSDTLMSKSNLAGTLFEAGRLQEAEKLEREVLARQVQILGPEHARTSLYRTDLAATLIREGHNDAEAEKLARHSFENQLKDLGPEHPDTVYSLQQLGTALARLHRYPEASRLFHEVIDKQSKAPSHGDRYSVWYSFACVAASAARTDDSLQYLRKAIDLGYEDAEGLMSDRELSSVRSNPRFQQLVAETRKRAAGAALKTN